MCSRGRPETSIRPDHPGVGAEAFAGAAGAGGERGRGGTGPGVAGSRPTRTGTPRARLRCRRAQAVTRERDETRGRVRTRPGAARHGLHSPRAPEGVRPVTVRPVTIRPCAVRPCAVRPVTVRPSAVRPVAVRRAGWCEPARYRAAAQEGRQHVGGRLGGYGARRRPGLVVLRLGPEPDRLGGRRGVRTDGLGRGVGHPREARSHHHGGTMVVQREPTRAERAAEAPPTV